MLPTQNLSSYIDHTLLRPDAKEEEIQRLCEEAKEYHFKTVCIESKWLTQATAWLKGSDVLPITVISFPGGNDPTPEKARQTVEAVERGAKEIDMVLNRDLLRAKNFGAVLSDIQSVVIAARKLPVKVILETSELSREEIISACVLAKAAGAHFVKTSTGFSKSGAKVEDVALMRQTVGSDMGVKASGGVRTRADAEKMIEAGANRLGTSASIAIVTGENAAKAGY